MQEAGSGCRRGRWPVCPLCVPRESAYGDRGPATGYRLTCQGCHPIVDCLRRERIAGLELSKTRKVLLASASSCNFFLGPFLNNLSNTAQIQTRPMFLKMRCSQFSAASHNIPKFDDPPVVLGLGADNITANAIVCFGKYD